MTAPTTLILLLVDDLLAGLHYGITILPRSGVADRIAARGTQLEAGSAAVTGLGRLSCEGGEHHHHQRDTQKPVHRCNSLHGRLSGERVVWSWSGRGAPVNVSIGRYSPRALASSPKYR